MFEDIYLEQEQLDLFCEMVEAMRSVPREERHAFFVSRTFGGDTLLLPGQPGKERKIYFGDLEEFTRQGLLSRSFGSRGSPNFDVTSFGYRYYDYIKQKSGINKIDETTSETSPPDLNIHVVDDLGAGERVNTPATSIFLSYAHEDQLKVEKISDKLSNDGFNVWLDKKELLPGDDWKNVIEESIENAQYILVFLSPHSVSKVGYIQREFKFVLEQRELRPNGQRYVIPILLEECEPPREFATIHWLKYWEEGAYQKLIDALTKE